MADSSALIQEPAVGSATAEVDAESLGTGPQGKPLRRERMQLAGALLAQIAAVLNAAPAGTEYALVVRPIPSTSAQPVSAASLPLPAGASTETTLALIKAKTDNLDVLLSTRTKPADTQPVSAASLPLPAGASTEATLALIKAKTDNLDVALSTRTKPADAQSVTGPLTDAQLRASAVPVSGPLTDAQLRASAVPMSAAALPLPAGAATEATLALEQSTVAKDVTLGTVAANPAAYTVLDRLYQLGLKIDATNKALAGLQQRPIAPKASSTLLHRN